LPCNERPTAKTNLMVAPTGTWTHTVSSAWELLVSPGNALRLPFLDGPKPFGCRNSLMPVSAPNYQSPGGCWSWQQIANQKGNFPMKSLVNANQKISSFLQELKRHAIEHNLNPEFLRRPISMTSLVPAAQGVPFCCNSPTYTGAAYLGYPTAGRNGMDADSVSSTNCVRQPFSHSD